MATFRGYRFVLLLTFLTTACGGSDEDTLTPPGSDTDVGEEVSVDAEVDTEPDVQTDVEVDTEPDVQTDAEVDAETDVQTDAEVDAETDVQTDVGVGEPQGIGGITSGGGVARSSRFVAMSATTGGVLERRSERFVAVGRVAIPFFAE